MKNFTLNNLLPLKKFLFDVKGRNYIVSENIISIDNCITRLRLEVNNVEIINKEEIKSSGAVNVVVTSENSVQVIIGPQVQFVADELKKL